MANGIGWEDPDSLPRRTRNDIPQSTHHVIQRGNNRNYIYENTRDKHEFLSILSTAVSIHGASLLHYVLMDNHYHLLIRIGLQPLSRLLWYLNRHYTLYYNQRYNRSGTIYGGRYKSYLLTEQEKLYSTIRYIVQNPVKAGMVAKPGDYRFSGHNAVLAGNRDGIIDRQVLLRCFAPDNTQALKRYIQCTESDTWSPKIGFATIIDREKEAEERLGCLLDRYLDENEFQRYRIMVLSGSRTAFVRDLRDTFIRIAITDGHALKDIADFLHVSHETVRRKAVSVTGGQ